MERKRSKVVQAGTFMPIRRGCGEINDISVIYTIVVRFTERLFPLKSGAAFDVSHL